MKIQRKKAFEIVRGDLVFCTSFLERFGQKYRRYNCVMAEWNLLEQHACNVTGWGEASFNLTQNVYFIDKKDYDLKRISEDELELGAVYLRPCFSQPLFTSIFKLLSHKRVGNSLEFEYTLPSPQNIRFQKRVFKDIFAGFQDDAPVFKVTF